MAYRFAGKLDPKRGFDGAAEYARHMCTLWLVFSISLGVELAMMPFGVPFRDLLGSTRLFSDAVAIAVLILCSVGMSAIIRRMADLQSPEAIKDRYDRLLGSRKILLLGIVVGTPMVFLLLCLRS